jgi:hypothetical protein
MRRASKDFLKSHSGYNTWPALTTKVDHVLMPKRNPDQTPDPTNPEASAENTGLSAETEGTEAQTESTEGEYQSPEMVEQVPEVESVNVIDSHNQRLQDRIDVRSEAGSNNRMQDLDNAGYEPGEQSLDRVQ